MIIVGYLRVLRALRGLIKILRTSPLVAAEGCVVSFVLKSLLALPGLIEKFRYALPTRAVKT